MSLGCIRPDLIRPTSPVPFDQRNINTGDLEIATTTCIQPFSNPDTVNAWLSTDITSCPAVFQRLLFNNQGFERYNPANLNGTRSNMTTVWNNYFSSSNNTDPATNSKIEDALVTTCKALPGGCNDVLNEICVACTQGDLIEDPLNARLCGCFIPDPDTGLINRCNPLCNKPTSIRSEFDPGSGIENKCTETLCIIDDLAINVALGPGGTGSGVVVNIDQFCNQCNVGNCLCYIDLDFAKLESEGIKINVNNQCAKSVCVQSEPDGTKVEIDCPKDLTVDTSETQGLQLIVSISLAIFILAVGLIITYLAT